MGWRSSVYALRETHLVPFTPATASQTLSLTCIAAGGVRITAFLDDDDDATGSSSSDYLDTCLESPRYVDTMVTAGGVTPVTLVLHQSCD